MFWFCCVACMRVDLLGFMLTALFVVFKVVLMLCYFAGWIRAKVFELLVVLLCVCRFILFDLF